MISKKEKGRILAAASLDPALTFTCRSVLSELMERVDEFGMVTIPMRKLGKDMGHDHAVICGTLQRLEEGSYIEVARRGKGRRASTYRVIPHRPPKQTPGE